MAKVIDITDKLSFDENPKLEIKGRQYEVNTDARTVLEIMGAFNSKSEVEAALEAYEKMFKEKDRKELNKLAFKDLQVVISEAMQLVQGGEEETPRE